MILKAEENLEKLKQEKELPAKEAPLVVPKALGQTLTTANKTLEKKAKTKSLKKLEEDVLDVIQGKKEKLQKDEPKKEANVEPKAELDEIEKMMLEYNIASPQELEKRHQELKTAK